MIPIELETAILLKEKGFKYKGQTAYDIETKEYIVYSTFFNEYYCYDKRVNPTYTLAIKWDGFNKRDELNKLVFAPFQEEVIEWLWVQHKLMLYIRPTRYYGFSVQVYSSDGSMVAHPINETFYDRNIAMEVGIVESLNRIK